MYELIWFLIFFYISGWLFDKIFPPKTKRDSLMSEVKKGIFQGTKPRSFLPTISDLKRDIPRIIGQGLFMGVIVFVLSFGLMQFA